MQCPEKKMNNVTVNLLILLLCAGGGGPPRRHAWDLKGKVSDMEDKISKYQTKVKSVNQENEVLKSSVNQSQIRVMGMEKELERQRSQIRCKDHFLCENCLCIINLQNCLFSVH